MTLLELIDVLTLVSTTSIFIVMFWKASKLLSNRVNLHILSGLLFVIFLYNFFHFLESSATDTSLEEFENIIGALIPVGWAFLLYDILQKLAKEDLAESEQKFQAIFNNSFQFMGLLNTKGILLEINDTALESIGLQRSNVLGKPFEETGWWVHSKEMQVRLKTAIKQATQGEFVRFDATHQDYDGKLLYVDFSMTPVKDKMGNVTLIIPEGRDITEQKLIEETLQRTTKMDALGKLTGGIAHDFNNLLGVILGYSNLLNESFKNQPNASKYIDQIHKAGERGANLTKKLLAFSRHDPSTKAVKFNINQLLLEQHELIQKTLTVRIQLQMDLESKLWLTHLDKSELEDAILNMSINTMHAIKNDGTLTVRTCNKTLNTLDGLLLGLKAGDYIQLSLMDTGCGMDDLTKSKLFDPFFTTKGSRGTGLGLSQVFGFVNRANGVVQVESEVGKGSKFILYFPRYFDGSAEETAESELVVGNLYGDETILVVDDEIPLLDVTSDLLKQHGYNIYCAESGQQALNVLEKSKVDLMLSDIIMPNMDGYQLAGIVQEKYPEIKIQLASGYTDRRSVSESNVKLHQKLLQKPYNSTKLLSNIRALLDSNEKEDIPQKANNKPNESSYIEPIIWSEQLSTSIPDIDKDHKVLIALLNNCIEMHNEMDSNDKSAELDSVLEELLNYTDYHFKREERIMEVCDYPNLHKHRLVHQHLLSSVLQKKQRYESGEETVDSIMNFLCDWLTGHIVGMDKSIGTHCKGKELLIENALLSD